MDTADRLLGLIETLYAAPGTDEGWPAFLNDLRAAMSGSAVSFISHDFRECHTGMMATTLTDAASLQEYRENWAAVDPWAYSERLHRMRAGDVVLGDECIPHAEVKRTAFYNEFARHHDVVRCVVGMIEAGPRAVSVISVNGSERHGPFNREQSTLLEALMPHLRRALQLHRRVTSAEAISDGVAGVIARSSRAVLLIDSGGRVTFMNPSASRLVAARDGLTVERGQLRAARPDDTTKLHALLADAIKTSTGDGLGAGGALAIGRPSDRRPLFVLVCPVFPARTLLPGLEAAAAMIFVSDPEQSTVPNEEMLQVLFGLTQAEAKLTRLVAEGASLVEAGAQLGLRRETVRSRMKTIFEKTSTHRQAELVRLVLNGTPHL